MATKVEKSSAVAESYSVANTGVGVIVTINGVETVFDGEQAQAFRKCLDGCLINVVR